MEDGDSKCKVCVIGGSGYIASWLIRKLLHKGYTVHGTLRSLDDKAKVGLLKSLPGAETRLELYEADIYKPNEFEAAIKGCEFVFHLATPFQHLPSSVFKDTVEATVGSAKSILSSCIKVGTVKRLIYTASVVAASPLKEDGSGFKHSMDESCWTPLDLSVAYSDSHLKAYVDAKTLTEKTLTYEDGKTLEVVSLACGLVGGDTVLPYLPDTISVLLSTTRLHDHEYSYQHLRFLEELLGKVPVLHIEDACEAHLFLMEQPSITGRYLCASSYVQSSEIAEYYKQAYPELDIKQECLEGPKRDITWGGTKLIEKGFVYKFDLQNTLDDCVKAAKRLLELPS